jgi:hypothetical protein
LEFAPTGQVLGVPIKTITVSLQSGNGYVVSSLASEQTVTINLENTSTQPCAKAAIRFLQQAAFGPNGDLKNVREVMKKGYDSWITEQFARPVGLQQPYIDHLKRQKHGDVYAEDEGPLLVEPRDERFPKKRSVTAARCLCLKRDFRHLRSRGRARERTVGDAQLL